MLVAYPGVRVWIEDDCVIIADDATREAYPDTPENRCMAIALAKGAAIEWATDRSDYIYSAAIATGRAYEDGREPTHDGEYICIYYLPTLGEYIAMDSGGLAWTSQTEIYLDADAELERQIGEIHRIMRDNDGSPDNDLSPAALDAARAMCWPLPN